MTGTVVKDLWRRRKAKALRTHPMPHEWFGGRCLFCLARDDAPEVGKFCVAASALQARREKRRRDA